MGVVGHMPATPAPQEASAGESNQVQGQPGLQKETLSIGAQEMTRLVSFEHWDLSLMPSTYVTSQALQPVFAILGLEKQWDS